MESFFMKLSDVIVKKSSLPFVNGYKALFSFDGKDSNIDTENRLFSLLSIDELIDDVVKNVESADYCHNSDFCFYGSGWQSWGFGGEYNKGEYAKKYIPLVPQWKQYITFPGKAPCKINGVKSSSGKLLEGEFIIYLRWNDVYLVIASTGSSYMDKDSLPPVRFYVDRCKRTIGCTVYSVGKKWSRGEAIAELNIFAVRGYFGLKDSIRNIYAPNFNERFNNLKWLSSREDCIKAGGWESWYNHYADINYKLISEDLESLGRTDNLIKTYFTDESKPTVFQVDDGWEIGLGEWEPSLDRFPNGMAELANLISGKGYIPGLWLAPFIIDWRTDFCNQHKDWILYDKKGKPVAAGFGLLWGDKFGKKQPGLPYSYFCFDLSQGAVIDYLDGLMDKVINKWGFRYLKLDFLFAGMLYGNFRNGGCAYQWYERALKVLTRRTTNNRGEKVTYLGCGVPLESSFTKFPLSRIGSDTKESWDMENLAKLNFTGRPGVIMNMQSTLGHAFWDQSVFINDPDVVFLRYNNITLSDTEKELIAVVNFLFASQIMHSDDPSDFSKDEKKLTSYINSIYKKFESEEFGHVNNTSKTYIIFNRSKTYCGFINLDDIDIKISKTDMFKASGIDLDKSVENVLGHFSQNGELYTFQKHSISIFAIK